MSDILQTLVDRGWRGPERDYASNSTYVWADRGAFPHRPTCDCNDRPASLCVYHYQYALPGYTHTSYEIALRFEKKGVWYDLKAYSLRSLDEIDAAIEPLIAAGRAVARERTNQHA